MMCQNVLLISIKPEYAKLIFDGKKTVELRRIRTRLEKGDLVLVYVSSPLKSLVGYFEVEGTEIKQLPSELNDFWKQVKDKSGINRKQFLDYYQGALLGVGIFIRNPQKFTNPIHLEVIKKDIEKFRPPQSYKYLDVTEIEMFQSIVNENFLSQPKQLTLNL
ncbi:ASCH domain-containing protein [Spirulina major]|uniref:ASCH domain-containing protein n=1 Tax=Spirulina major TaxID=270636 RepID=UPI001C317D77|nr:ASCH domain-containing protein [Spirulina major]